MVELEWGPDGRPVRASGVPGEWVRFYGEPVQFQGPPRLADLLVPRRKLEASADPLREVVDRLVRQYDPGGYRLSCPVAGCRWTLDVPRMELDPESLDSVSGDYVIRAEGVPREDVELVLRTHLDWHAVLSETGAQDVPLPEPPTWARWDLDQLHDEQDEAAALARLDGVE